jgi:para-nitrobenzyl esterase
MKTVSIAAAALLFATLAHAQVPDAEVTGGRVAGAIANGIAVFKGIPFAAPPTGELRWRAPQPVTPWQGVKDATKWGPACMQDAMFPAIFGAPMTELSEDCLYLNIWTPAKTTRDKLAVMVWIYGGGFVGGQTSVPLYDGTRLADKGVIVVSVAYRLGAFGFLAHPELSKESGNRGSGNYGLQDQIAGLRWVKDNIAKFGGDPDKVTIFGESAGGMSVSMLAASPGANELFQRAISESGGNFGGPKYRNGEGGVTSPSLGLAEASGQQFLEKLGVKDIAAARAMSAEAIQKGVGPGLQASFFPVFDGKVLPKDQYKLYQSKKFNDTPVLIGTNSDEGALFMQTPMKPAQFEQFARAGFGSKADGILAAYPHSTDAEASQAAKDVMRESTFAWHTWAWATLQAEHGKGKAFVYYFDHRTPQSPHGSNHGSEIAYVFRTLDAGAGPLFGVPSPPRPIDVQVSEMMSSYWTNFAKTGDPNGPGLPPWPAFSLGEQKVLVFDDDQPGARPVPNMTQIKALDLYYTSRRQSAQTAP